MSQQPDFYILPESSSETLKKLLLVLREIPNFQEYYFSYSDFLGGVSDQNKIFQEVEKNIISRISSLEENDYSSHVYAISFDLNHRPSQQHQQTHMLNYRLNNGIGEIRFLSNKNILAPAFLKHFKLKNIFEIQKDGVASLLNHQIETLKLIENEERSKLQELQSIGAKIIADTAAQANKLSEDLHRKFQGRESELHAEHAQKLADIDKREAELKAKIEEFNLQESKGVRRQIFDHIKKIIEDRRNFSFSKELKDKRNATFYTCTILELVSMALMTAGIMISLQQKSLSYLCLSGSGFALFVSTSIYYIRWSNSFEQQQLKVEMDNLNFEKDILRASWIAEFSLEVARDAKALENSGIIKILIENYSKDLFINDLGGVKAANHPYEDLFNLLNRFKKLKAGDGGVEIEK